MSVGKQEITEVLSNYVTKSILAEGVAFAPDVAFSDVEIDSVTVVELVMMIEEEFGIEIPVDQLVPENLQSLESLVDCALKNANVDKA
ncbi:MAG: acyl carrier protein [Flavobacteriales bacterium]|jgi:acyl carrier protein|nr:acyl carrier protein [Flavobacteriales bacterium]